MIFLVVFIFSSLFGLSSTANILVYSPAFAGSHMNFMAHLADTLTEGGHNVTFLVPISDESRRHQLGVKVTKDVYVVEQDEEMRRTYVPIDEEMDVFWTIDPQTENVQEMFRPFRDMMESSCANFLRNPDVLEDMKKKNFDLAIAEPVSACGIAFFKLLGIEKTILSSSCVHYDGLLKYIGEPEAFSYVPTLSSGTGDDMTLSERHKNYRLGSAMAKHSENLFTAELGLYKNLLGVDLPHWSDLLSSASLYFTNSNPYIDFPRPVIQKTVPIGGITVNMEKILSDKVSDEWNEVLNRRSRSMLISFGSMVQSYQMPIEWRHNLLEVIKSMPDVTFIWKYETNNTQWADGVSNLYFSKWVPQSALLGDDRLTAFLTHGGLGSTNELAYCGKPALMVPIFGDQTRNANMLARHNGTIVIKKEELGNKEVIGNAIRKILYHKSYKRNAQKLADLLQNQPLTPKELVLKHTEFVAKYGPFPKMDPRVRHLNYFQQNFIDIYAITALSYFSIFSILVVSARYLLSRISIKVSTKKSTKTN